MYKIFLTIIIVLSFNIAFGDILLVGNDEQYKTPHKALQDVHDGDTIKILTGTYESDTAVEFFGKNNITIIGQEETELLCTNMLDNVFWIINSTNITIRNIKASHTDPTEDERCYGNVFGIDSSDDIFIENCDINGCGAIGVYVFNSTNVTLRDNYIHDNTLWAVQFDGTGLLSEDNSIAGLFFENNQIENNGVVDADIVFDEGTVEGIFAGIVWTDYPHIIIVQADEELSFWVSPVCEGFEQLAINPDQYIDKEIRVTWQEINRYIEEAQDVVKLKEVTSIEILD